MKKAIRSVLLKAAASVAAAVVLGHAVLYVGAKAPLLHNNYIREKVGSQVVYAIGPKGGGTGFHAKASSGRVFIITNKHVCVSGGVDGFINIGPNDKNKLPVSRRIIELSTEHDLCIVEALPGYSGLKLSSSDLALGDLVTVVGHPHLQPLTISNGEFIGEENIKLVDTNNKPREECKGEWLDTSENIYALLQGISSVCYGMYNTKMVTSITYPGNSGSPAVDFSGNVVGVLFAGSSISVLQAFLVPASYLQNLLDRY